MGQTAEQLKQDIAGTRDNLSETLDAIGDRVSPARVIERRKNRMTGGVRAAVDRVMGTAHDVVGTAHDAADKVRDTPATIGSGTQGAPLVAAGVAFAAGFLLAVAFPPSEQETELASHLVEPVKDELTNTGRELADHLQAPAQEAVEQVKQTAQQGATAVKDTATDAANDTRQQAQTAVNTIKNETTDQ